MHKTRRFWVGILVWCLAVGFSRAPAGGAYEPHSDWSGRHRLPATQETQVREQGRRSSLMIIWKYPKNLMMVMFSYRMTVAAVWQWIRIWDYAGTLRRLWTQWVSLVRTCHRSSLCPHCSETQLGKAVWVARFFSTRYASAPAANVSLTAGPRIKLEFDFYCSAL